MRRASFSIGLLSKGLGTHTHITIYTVMITRIYIIILLSGSWMIQSTYAQGCGGTIGDSTEKTTDLTTVTDVSFLVFSHLFTCHGQIDAYNFYVRNGGCDNMVFQIWRPIDVANGVYMHIGSSPYNGVAACMAGTKTVDPLTVEEVPIQPGDVYGWTDSVTTTNRPLTYDDAPGGSGSYEQIYILDATGACTPAVGDNCNWNGQQQVVREYGLELVLTDRPDPYFANLPYTTSMFENSPAGTFVYQVDGVNHFSYISVINPDITYSINGGSCDLTHFLIDPITGIIILTSVGVLDFEGGACTLIIRVIEGPYFGTGTLTMDIQDVNEPHTINNLPESIVIDSLVANNNFPIINVAETDLDIFPPTRRYNIEYSNPPNPPFDIDPISGRVQTTQDMEDWIGPTRYVLGITLDDADHSDGPKELTIVIDNVRTNPIITNLHNTITIPENSVIVGTQIFRVTGLPQPDARANNNPITFHLVAIHPLNTPTGIFDVDLTSGWVTHIANPGFDYFGTRSYNIEVEVRDADSKFVSEHKNLTVDITWVNQAPVHVPTAYASTIDEKEPIGTELPDIKLDATDRDIPVGDWIGYQVFGLGSHLFYVDNITERVYVNSIITVAPGLVSETYNLNMLVFDSHGETATVPLTVTVLDINDKAPVCNPEYYTGTIVETAIGGTATGVTILATDLDGGQNREIVFTIIEPLGDLYFQVDAVGVVTNKQPIPYDVYTNITFTVLASDKGNPSLNDTARVHIIITELNTNKPLFIPDFYSLDLRSDTAVGSIIHTVNASDLDTDSVQDMSYYWLILQEYFTLEANSGDISIYREVGKFQKYLLYIGALDNGNPLTYYSDQYTLRIDTYEPKSTLIDIYLTSPLDEFLLTSDAFMSTLDKALAPWDMRLESYRSEGANTIVRVYGVESDLPDLEENQDMTKIFINEDDLIKILRKNLQGDPTGVLTDGEFYAWGPYKVQPAYPVWITDTPGGVAFLTILCLLLLAGLITMFVLLAKKYRWFCYKYRPNISPRKVVPYQGSKDQFKLNYITPNTPAVKSPIYNISDNYNAYAGLFPSAPFKADGAPPPAPPKYSPSKNNPSYDARASVNTPLHGRGLPPVQTPEPPLPPRGYHGQAA